MKLLTHNMLTSKCLKGVSVGYPLGILAKDVKVSEVDFNPEFVSRIIPKLDWTALWNAADSLGAYTLIQYSPLLDGEVRIKFEIKRQWNTATLTTDIHIKIGHSGELPKTIIPDYENNQEFLKKAHHVLMEVEVINGELVCPESGRKFPISDGIPNMLLNEDEV